LLIVGDLNMEQNQPETRETANKDFIQSLDQLQEILLVGETEDKAKPKLETDSANDDLIAEDSVKIDMAAFETAVNDIEQYIEKKTGE
jgi:hypothetical protein